LGEKEFKIDFFYSYKLMLFNIIHMDCTPSFVSDLFAYTRIGREIGIGREIVSSLVENCIRQGNSYMGADFDVIYDCTKKMGYSVADISYALQRLLETDLIGFVREKIQIDGAIRPCGRYFLDDEMGNAVEKYLENLDRKELTIVAPLIVQK
jgi:hypothetical protein